MLNERGERILNAGGRPWSNGSQERAMTDEPEDFAAMFEASLKTSRAKRLVTGETVEGTIVALGPEVAFVDVGGKAEATIEVGELKDAEGDIEVAVGDRIRAMVVSTAGGLRLSRKLVRGAAVDRQLEDAFRAGLPVEGRVENEIKGGYEVRIGHQRAFCPFSQIDVHRSEPATHLGKVYTFRILECGNGGRNLVVSRRALLEEEQQAKAAEVRRSVVAGAVLTGRVASVPAFGAFVDLGGGVQGLLHVSEMGWSRVADPSALFKPGDEVTVKVLRVDDERQKIALGLKQLEADPWSRVAQTYEVGQVLQGRVARVAEFGVFVELAPGIEGLVHASTFASTGGRAEWSRKAVAVGAVLEVMVTEIDPEARRIGLSVRAVEDARVAQEMREYAERDDAGPAFGSLADKLRGALKPDTEE
jgi:small subunit ribosomal protein S1